MSLTQRNISRRAALQWVAATSVVSSFPAFAQDAGSKLSAFEPTKGGYGTDPALNNSVVTWSRTMNARQLQLSSSAADIILPCTNDAPAPSALYISDVVDEWISAPYPLQRVDRVVVLEGLEWLDLETMRRWHTSFLDVHNVEREAIITDIAKASETGALGAQNKFFNRFRYLVVAGYYTTSQGFADIGYIGDLPLAEYPQLTADEKRILDERLGKLGVPPT
jgi:Gluconate 2-dehydrogenase subunit 3